jgi:UDP-N-acetyl-D-mannosaminuronic acid dehydrogenase
VNLHKTEYVVGMIENAIGTNGGSVALLGASFKPDVDDVRESPALAVADRLRDSGYQVLVVEPNVEAIEGHDLVPFELALAKAATIAVLVGHREFRTPAVQSRLREAGAIDFCGALQ